MPQSSRTSARPRPPRPKKNLACLAALLLLLPLQAGADEPGSANQPPPAPAKPAPPRIPVPPKPEAAPPRPRIIIVDQDATTTVSLSATGLNRLQFPDTITAAHTNSDAIDVTLEGPTAIITFRTPQQADLLVITQLGEFLLRLVPTTQPLQTIRIRQARRDSHATSSYQTQLTELIEAAYRREPPKGYKTEQPARGPFIDGALQWWLTTRYHGHTYTVDEYQVRNSGALLHSLEPTWLAQRFPRARAVSGDPLRLPPGQWGRVLVIEETVEGGQ